MTDWICPGITSEMGFFDLSQFGTLGNKPKSVWKTWSKDLEDEAVQRLFMELKLWTQWEASESSWFLRLLVLSGKRCHPSRGKDMRLGSTLTLTFLHYLHHVFIIFNHLLFLFWRRKTEVHRPVHPHTHTHTFTYWWKLHSRTLGPTCSHQNQCGGQSLAQRHFDTRPEPDLRFFNQSLAPK